MCVTFITRIEQKRMRKKSFRPHGSCHSRTHCRWSDLNSIFSLFLARSQEGYTKILCVWRLKAFFCCMRWFFVGWGLGCHFLVELYRWILISWVRYEQQLFPLLSWWLWDDVTFSRLFGVTKIEILFGIIFNLFIEY